MIKEATGSTTGGVPINLNKTTYDDVYGRMGMFRFGAAYRETPRTESVFNVIISRSAAQTVNIGTVGGTPLGVNFTDFNYWGVEGGQRVFFARTRFTPVRRVPVWHQPERRHQGHLRCTVPPGDARPGGTRRKVLREVLGAQFGPYCGIPRRPWPHRVDCRDAVPLDERSVGCRLARRGGLARHQQRELAVVDPVHGRRENSVLTFQTTGRPVTRRDPGDLPARRSRALSEGLRPSDSPTRSLARRAGARRSRASLAALARFRGRRCPQHALCPSTGSGRP